MRGLEEKAVPQEKQVMQKNTARRLDTIDRTITQSKPEHHALCLCPKGLINIYANQDNEIIMIDM